MTQGMKAFITEYFQTKKDRKEAEQRCLQNYEKHHGDDLLTQYINLELDYLLYLSLKGKGAKEKASKLINKWEKKKLI
jgi:hypothetical protein